MRAVEALASGLCRHASFTCSQGFVKHQRRTTSRLPRRARSEHVDGRTTAHDRLPPVRTPAQYATALVSQAASMPEGSNVIRYAKPTGGGRIASPECADAESD